MKNIIVGTATSKASLDTNFRNIQDNFVKLSKAFGSLVNVEWFGAIPDAVFDVASKTTSGSDSSPAFQAAIDYIEANGLDGLFVPGAYFLGSQVSGSGNWCIKGTTSPKFMDSNPASQPKNFITGAVGIDSLFLLRGNNYLSYSAYGFEISNVALIGYGPTSAIKSIASGAPARPFNVLSIYAKGFTNVIHSISTEELRTGICNLNVHNSVFVGNTNAVYSIGPSSIMGLNFSGNVSEAGGRIRIEKTDIGGGSFSGALNISDNMMEGQTDPILIQGGLFSGSIKRNYFERPAGTQNITISATNPRSHITIEDNHRSGVASQDIIIKNITANISSRLFDGALYAHNITNGSFINGNKVTPVFTSYNDSERTFSPIILNEKDVNIDDIDPNTSIILSSRVVEIAGDRVAKTRFGSVNAKILQSELPPETLVADFVVNNGDIITISVLVKNLDATAPSASFGFICREYDAPYFSLASDSVALSAIGCGWNILTLFIRPPESGPAYPMSGIRFRLRTDVAESKIEHSDFYITTIPGEQSVYPFFPAR